ncbi:dihydrofolate reductase family protein [Legionella bononiensis]|uniref:Dihydrofolate reductase n=1 Tax=Legionella bononiensis TaxID=2793102 RepID=A0ABS1WA05_9GAMM|nr:dihydrofolate reductase family protein [Legionella bononiensis]MBL7480571.1 dihydrofolate reductase [Legionella bononiensis]MBL7526190.1 dihydrofolate reductase [Legionella bononiensis]MBL7563315.1 dihydrofolate reductase [Legionella bononiensis]
MQPPKCSVFIATSLDGYIARDDGAIDWLMKSHELVPQGEDCGYKKFIATVDTLIMGRASYEKIRTFEEWPYGQLPVIVMSSQNIQIPEHLSSQVSVTRKSPEALIEQLRTQGVKHVYIDGGITVQGFLAKKLIDELTITYIPVLIGSGRPLFGALKEDITLKLIETETFGSNIVQVKYSVEQ